MRWIGLYPIALVLVSSRVFAASCDLDLNGEFHIHQSNEDGGQFITWNMQETSGRLSGSFSDEMGASKRTGNILSGTANDDTADFIAETTDHFSRGHYTFTIDRHGHMISGSTDDLNHPGSSAILSSEDTFCR